MVSRRQWLGVMTAFVVAAALCASAAGAVRVDVLSPPKDAAPGDVVTHVFSVSHDGATEETFALAVDGPNGWAVLGVPPEIAVAPGEEGVVFVTLTVPSDAAAGSYVLTLRATSAADPTDEATAGIATRVSIVNKVELAPPDLQSVSPGGSVTYSVVVTNRGNAQDVLALAVTSSRGYPTGVSVSSLGLSPRESREVIVTLQVPADATPGRDVEAVTASSTLYAGVEDKIALFTTILPPGPDAVGGTLYEILPTQISLEIQRDETTGAFDSQGSLSVSGTIFDGTFGATFTALHPFGSGPVDVTAYSLSYRLDKASFALGNVSQTLTDLQAIACDGGSTVVDSTYVDVGLIAGGSGSETRFGGRLALGPEEAQVGASYSDRRTDLTQSTAWTGTLSVRPFQGWGLRAEGGLGTVDAKRGLAGFLGTTVEGETYFSSADVFSVDTFFPGPRNDQAGIEASQRLRLSALSLGLSFAHTWNNVVRDPLAPTLVEDSLGVNLSTTPWKDGPTFQGTVTIDRKHQDNGVPRDDVNALLAYDVAETQGSFSYEFSGRMADRLDLVLGTWERTVTHTQQVGLSVDGLGFLLKLSEEQVVDLAHDLVLHSAATATLTLRPGKSPHEASIEFRSVGDQLNLGASFVLHATDSLSVSLDSYAEWKRGTSAARFGWSVGVDATLGMPLPFLITKGHIEGHVFVDRNSNSLRDEGEPPAEAATVFIEEGEVSTNAEGQYRFPPLAPKRYHLDVRGLPQDTTFEDPIPVDVVAGVVKIVDVPLTPVLSVRGVVFNDANQNEIREAEETGFSGIRVNLAAADGTIVSTRTDERGAFAFTNARPGSYVVTLDSRTLPDRFSYTTPESQTVDAASGGPILFGGFIRPRQVVVTFQPPTADGTYTPSAPKVGETVTFDSSASFDFDGTIVATSWDFDGDGNADSTDVVATHVFSAAGTYHVTLKVTDDAGTTDSQVLDVQVAPAPSSAVPTTPPVATRPPIADFSYTPVAPIAGQAVAFNAAPSVDFDGALVRFAWDFDGDGTPDAEGIAAQWTFAVAGSYDVTLIVTDAQGSSDSVTYAVDISAAKPVAPPASGGPQARFRFSPLVPAPGQAVGFDATASVHPAGSGLEYAWDFDGNGTSDGDGPAAEWVFDAVGVYPVTLFVVTADGQSNSLTLSVPVVAPGAGGEKPAAALQYLPANPQAGEGVMFNGTASTDRGGRMVAYEWDFNADGLYDSSEAITVHTFATAGSYPVRLTVVDDSGNSNSADVVINVR